MKVLVKVPLSIYSGYGNDGIGLVKALLNIGADVYLQPAHVDPPLPEELTDLLQKRLVAPFDLLIHHVDPNELGVLNTARRASAYTVGWSMWEYSNLSNLPRIDTFCARVKNFDALIGYDHVTTEAFRQALVPSLYHVPHLGTVQGGFWPEDWPYMRRDWSSPVFRFAMVGQLHERKDPFVSVAAFQKLKEIHGDNFNAELHLKNNIPNIPPALAEMNPGIFLHCDSWTQEKLRSFYGGIHCLLAPSRGEGKNMPALEIMSTGAPVIATNWGGHQMWMGSDIGYPLNYSLSNVSGQFPGCQNARASVEHMATLMWHAYTHREEVARKGELASEYVNSACSWDTVVGSLFRVLATLDPIKGKTLFDKYAECVG